MTKGCCRTITDYLTRVRRSRVEVEKRGALKDRVDTLYDAMGLYREILSRYQVSRLLTQAYRRDLEPTLANVWTAFDLANFQSQLSAYAKRLEVALEEWANKYCNGRKSD